MTNARVALVSTVRNPGKSIESFVRYHLSHGVQCIFLFFDDPNDPWMETAAIDPRVEIVPCDDDLRECWPNRSPVWAHREIDVMARQIMNAELAVLLAAERGYDWLLHLDADEAICSGSEGIDAYLTNVADHVDQVTFANLEVVPDRLHVQDWFAELTLFKRNRCSLGSRLAENHDLLVTIRQLPTNWFFYYANGKSAVRVRSDIHPAGVHSFGGCEGRPLETLFVDQPRILHYMNAGFENFWRRYQTWGHFPDNWLGSFPIRDGIGDFHLQARDIVSRNDPEAAMRFYYDNIVIENNEHINALILRGLCERVMEPSESLRRWRV